VLWNEREKRKTARVEGQFEVMIRERIATWVALTEDVSQRGCRILLGRPLRLGALVELAFDMGPEADPLVVHGQIAWVHRSAPRCAGVTFLCAPRQPSQSESRSTPWFDLLRAASGG
jgi:hypothetical protein